MATEAEAAAAAAAAKQEAVAEATKQFAGEGWRGVLPPELRDAPVLKDTKDLPGLVKQFVDVQAHLGNSIRIPGKDAGAEDIKVFHQKLVERVPGLYYMPAEGDEAATAALFAKLGRPSDPKEYEVPVPKDGAEIPGFRDVVHKQGLSKKQVKELAAWWAGVQESAVKTVAEAHGKEMTQLDAEWGAAKQPKVEAIASLAEKTGAPPEMLDSIRKGNIGAKTLRWLDGLVKAVGTEGTQLVRGKNDQPTTLTPQEAERQIDEIMRRPEYRENSPLGASLRAKQLELAKVAWPG